MSSLGRVDRNTRNLPRRIPNHSQETSNTSLREPAPLFDSDTMSTNSSNLHHLSPMSNATTLTPSISSYNPNDGLFLPSSNSQLLPVEASTSSLPPLQGPQSAVSGTLPPSTTDAIRMHTSPESGLSASIGMTAQSYGVAPQANSKYNDMIIESQDIDTSALGMDPLLWLDFVPQNVLDHFDFQNDGSTETSTLKH